VCSDEHCSLLCFAASLHWAFSLLVNFMHLPALYFLQANSYARRKFDGPTGSSHLFYYFTRPHCYDCVVARTCERLLTSFWQRHQPQQRTIPINSSHLSHLSHHYIFLSCQHPHLNRWHARLYLGDCGSGFWCVVLLQFLGPVRRQLVDKEVSRP
jgi:hypothetical protein